MDRLFCLISGAMLYASAPFLLAALALRVLGWLRVPRSVVHLGLFGRHRPREARWAKLGKDLFLFPQVLDLDRPMWGFVIAFHIAGTLLLLGHLRLISEFTPLARALGHRGMERFALVTGGTVGSVLMICALYFLLSRVRLPGRRISAPQDYFLLILILLVISSGNWMRFFGHVPITAYRDYVNSVLSLGPYVPTALDTPLSRWSLGIHVMLANVLLFYLPFSKLVHIIESVATALIRTEYSWTES